MGKKRKKINDPLHARPMLANARTCCVCREVKHAVQIDHIDDNPSHDAWENLAVVCVRCHSEISADQGFARAYTISEVRAFKSEWEAIVASRNQTIAGLSHTTGRDVSLELNVWPPDEVDR